MQALSNNIDEVDVVRIEGRTAYILGKTKKSIRPIFHVITYDLEADRIVNEESFEGSTPYHALGIVASGGLYLLNRSLRKKLEKQTEYDKLRSELTRKNEEDWLKAVDGIRIYQGSMDEVSRDIGRKLRRIDTGKPATYIKGSLDFELRAEALNLGADAIIHYQPGSSLGTPVKFVD